MHLKITYGSLKLELNMVPLRLVTVHVRLNIVPHVAADRSHRLDLVPNAADNCSLALALGIAQQAWLLLFGNYGHSWLLKITSPHF